ncbi:MAG TPA: glycoside hydrolase family 130 protein [Saprospiraceae bacterium]|nr:glycoside hydrolase family 130 protein [Saprospiraceae bacterium]
MYLPAMRHLSLLLLCLLAACSGSRRVSDEAKWGLHDVQRFDANNPVLHPDAGPRFRCPLRRDPVRWQESMVACPAAVVREGRMCLLYRAEDATGTSRIGLAESGNGLGFSRRNDPVLHPDRDDHKDREWPGGCEDPRIVRRDDGLYVMTYTAYDGSNARLCIATSGDLSTWEKRGLAFPQKKHRSLWSKAGAIVCERTREGDVVACKVKGKYWMYWGDADLYVATSDDLLSWEPEEEKGGSFVRALTPRASYFDSRSVEAGPFALLRREGILLVYNSTNSASSGDKGLAADAPAVGQALFSKTRPAQLLARANAPLLQPERAYEQGDAGQASTFLSGMAWWHDRWLLYFSAGSRTIAAGSARE